jgi:hypothetical protein
MHDSLKGRSEIAVARTGVPEQAAVFAEEEEEERHLRIGASGLAKDIEIRVVFVDLPLRYLHAFGAAGHPLIGQDSALEIAAVGLGKLGLGADGSDRQECEDEEPRLHEFLD